MLGLCDWIGWCGWILMCFEWERCGEGGIYRSVFGLWGRVMCFVVELGEMWLICRFVLLSFGCLVWCVFVNLVGGFCY